MTHRAVIGVGSNIDADQWIPEGRRRLQELCQLKAESDFVTTSPIGFTDQPDFVNGAWLVETEMHREDLEWALHSIEAQCGRVRTANKYGPRTLDLDLLVWEGKVVDEDVYDRPFLKEAVQTLLPDLKL